MDRYARQIILPQVGQQGQAKIAAAHVLVVGIGGLGCPVLQYLAGAGVGRITLVDHDTVEESNLHRQPLYALSDVGQPKVLAAKAALARLNPHVDVLARVERLTPLNAASLVAEASVVVDAGDSFAVTYALNDACHDAGIPFISASLVGVSGYVGGYCGGAPSYRAVFPDIPAQAATCATAGVLGPVVGMFGTLEAQFALQVILGMQPSPLGRVVTYDAERLAFGGFSFAGAPEPAGEKLAFLAPEQVSDADFVVDLRGEDEAPVSPFAQARRVSVESVAALAPEIAPSQRVVLVCRTGVRSARAARLLAEQGVGNAALVAMG